MSNDNIKNNVFIDGVTKYHNELYDMALRFFAGEYSLNLMPYVYDDDPSGRYPVKGSYAWDYLVTHQPNYYLYRNETDLIANKAEQLTKILSDHIQNRPVFVDMGPGSEASVSKKTLPFLSAIKKEFSGLSAYVPIDLSKEFLDGAVNTVRKSFPDTIINPLKQDFFNFRSSHYGRNEVVVFFPGATIGNVPEKLGTRDWKETIKQLSLLHDVIGKNGILAIGYDANNDRNSLLEAYDNEIYHNHVMCILHRFQWGLPGVEFDVEDYRCHVDWKAADHRISYFAKARKDTLVKFMDKTIKVPCGTKLHIGSSFKYPVNLMTKLAYKSGLKSLGYVQDDEKRMTLHLLKSM